MKRNRNRMGLDKNEILATAGKSQNGGARIGVESVSAGMRTVEAMIRELSQNDLPVLVVAEHGSGKAAAAARTHALSSRATEPFQIFQARDVSEQILAALGEPLTDSQGGTVYLQDVAALST